MFAIIPSLCQLCPVLPVFTESDTAHHAQSLKEGLSQAFHPVWSMWEYCWDSGVKGSLPLANITGKKVGTSRVVPPPTLPQTHKCHQQTPEHTEQTWYNKEASTAEGHFSCALNEDILLIGTEQRKGVRRVQPKVSIREKISFTWSYEKRITKYECFRRTV